jgi:hypothetical protein
MGKGCDAMNQTVEKVLFWSPRVLGILIAIFISLFALDVFGEGYSFWETIIALGIDRGIPVHCAWCGLYHVLLGAKQSARLPDHLWTIIPGRHPLPAGWLLPIQSHPKSEILGDGLLQLSFWSAHQSIHQQFMDTEHS